MRFGLPYKGSKNKIAREIVSILPPAPCFVDLFAGGCAVSHAAMLSGKYGRIIANDIDKKFPELFRRAASGDLPEGYDRFVSREEFHALKDKDAIVSCVWSFGNNCLHYLWNTQIERTKEIAFKLIMSDSRAERTRLFRMLINNIKTGAGKLRTPESLERIQSLQSLERIQSLELLNRFEVSGVDYREIRIPNSAVVYCDPPYAGTNEYSTGTFDSARFWKWAEEASANNLLFVSEYAAPNGFVDIWNKEKTCSFCDKNNSKKTIEKLFVHEGNLDKWRASRRGQLDITYEN